MDIHEYLGVLRRGWALIVLGLLVGIAGGAAANVIQPRTYSATSREILTNGGPTSDLTQSLQASNLAEGRIASYVLVATSGLVLQPVIDKLGLDTTVDKLAQNVSVVAPPNTLIVEITATAKTPALAKSIANTVSSVFSDVIENQIENSASTAAGATPAPTDSTATTTTTADGTAATATDVTPVRIVNIEHASLPTSPTFSNAPLLLAVGAVLGLALGLVAASLREALDRRIRSRKDVAAVSDRPVLGHIRPDRAARSNPTVMHSSPQSAIAESFRGLRASVEHVRARDGINTFVITSMAPRQGASLVAANLALAIADTSTSVVVVDANLQSPQQADIFQLPADPGLTDLLTMTATIEQVIAAGPGENISVLPIGSRRARSADLLATPRMRALLAELSGRFDVVIVDAPAVSTATDAAVLGSFGAATLLVIAEGSATRPELGDALGALAAGGSVPAGIVLNRIPRYAPGLRPPVRVSAPRPTRVAPPIPVLNAPPSTPFTPAATPPVPVVPDPVVPVRATPVVPVPAPRVIPPTLRRAELPPIVETPAVPPIPVAESRPQAPVSRFAPKPVESASFALPPERRRSTPVVDAVPVLDTALENSDSVIDVPRASPDDRVSLLTPQPGDPTPEQLAEIIAHQFEDDVVYDVPVEAFDAPGVDVPSVDLSGVDLHGVDAAAFAAVDRDPAAFSASPIAPATPAPAMPVSAIPAPAAPLTEENAAFVIDLLADEPVYAQPRVEQPYAVVDDDADEPVYDIPMIQPVQPVAADSSFIAPASWPAPRVVTGPVAVPSPGKAEPVAEEPAPEEDTAEGPVLARVTVLPTRAHLAHESFLLKSRELERAAHERLRYEQERLEARVREQLEADRRQLAGKLDELLEDTVMLPRTGDVS